MTRSTAERISARTTPRQSPVGPSPDVGRRSRQLTLIDVGDGAGAGREGLDLPEQIAALERELRYYRRLIPVLTRASVRPRRASPEHAGELTHLARWLTDGSRVIDSISRTLAEQRQLEIRLEALERAHSQVRDEIAQLFGDGSDESDAGPGMFGTGWVRVGLVALILVIVLVSVPYFIDWWQAVIQRHG